MIACEQALRVTLAVGWEKEGELATTAVRLAIFNICIKKVDAKCWLVEMTLVMTSNTNTFTNTLIGQKSDCSVDGEQQGNWRWNSNSRDLIASSPSFSRPAARAPERTCSQANVMKEASIWIIYESGLLWKRLVYEHILYLLQVFVCPLWNQILYRNRLITVQLNLFLVLFVLCWLDRGIEPLNTIPISVCTACGMCSSDRLPFNLWSVKHFCTSGWHCWRCCDFSFSWLFTMEDFRISVNITCLVTLKNHKKTLQIIIVWY